MRSADPCASRHSGLRAPGPPGPDALWTETLRTETLPARAEGPGLPAWPLPAAGMPVP